MKVRILERGAGYEELKDLWNQLVLRHGTGISHFDVTATYEWAMALWEIHLKRTDERILILEEAGKVQGILPLYFANVKVRSVACVQVLPLSELYSQRCGFVLADTNGEQLGVMMRHLFHEVPDWDVFEFTLVDESASDRQFKAFLESNDIYYELVGSEKSPYMELSVSWAAFQERLSTKFRSNLRSYEKKLRSLGELKYKTFHGLGEAGEFLAAMFAIEQDSWKEKAGTSITGNSLQESFYKHFIKVAAERGWFSGHLLLIGDEPIAYIYGLVFNGCFSSMKTSYKEKYQKMGTGHVVRMFALQQLHAEGVKIHDFTGLCEDHKLAWADSAYSRTTYRVYNKTIRGIVIRALGKLSALRKWAGRGSVK